MAAKKAKKPGVQSGQGYADRFKKSENKAFAQNYVAFANKYPSLYGGAKGAIKFANDYKKGMRVGDDNPKADVAATRRKSSGDMGAARAAGRAKTVRKKK